MIRNTPQSWGVPAWALHWSVAALVLSQFVLGWLAMSWRLSPAKLELFSWHKSIGVLILGLTLVRLIWRLNDPGPRLPPMPRWQTMAARTNHAVLYALLLVMPLTGWVINSAANIPFRVFWWIPLPDITAPDKQLEEVAKDIHFALFVLLAVAVLLHVAAALHHHFVARDDVLRRMLLPGRGRRE